jgi:hypothetical protein
MLRLSSAGRKAVQPTPKQNGGKFAAGCAQAFLASNSAGQGIRDYQFGLCFALRLPSYCL